MQITELDTRPRADIETWLTRVPFFKELRLADPGQLETLLSYCCLVELNPGETIMRRGQRGHWLYFLLKGGLQVFREAAHVGTPLADITPGELFGDLALLQPQEARRATVAAAPGKPALLLAFDFRSFGELDDIGRVTLATKLQFYRMIVHSIRWRLEVNRMVEPKHPLVAEMLRLPVAGYRRETLDELRELHVQAVALGQLLDRWNAERGGGEGLVLGAAEKTN